MPYDPDQDKVLKSWECEETGLVVSINQYAEGEPKLQIGPRYYTRKDGQKSQRKAGRLTIEDVQWLFDTMDEIRDEMEDLVPPE
ncbi:MAG: hypothetical protein ACLFOY_00415 [Desulfatibacillaceae bacterium]